MKKNIVFLVLILLGSALAGFSFGRRVEMPLAEARPETLSIHNQTLVDNWSWLRDREDPALATLLDREERYTRAMMKPSRSLSRRLYKEFKANSEGNFRSYPHLRNGYLYYYRQPAKKHYAINCRKADRPGAREEVLLDENRLARGKDYFYLDEFRISPNGRYLAYSTDTEGDENYRLYIKDLESGNTLDTGITNFSECRWRADNEHLILTRTNSRFQTDTVWQYNRISREEVLIYRENDPAFDLGIYQSTDRALIFLQAASKNTTEAWFIPSTGTSTAWEMLAPRREGHKYYPDYFEGLFYIESNRMGSGSSIFVCSERDTREEVWRVIVPGLAQAPIDDFLLLDSALVVQTRHQGFPRLEVYDRRGGGQLYGIPNQEISDYSLWFNEDPSASFFYYTRESELSPTSIYKHNLVTRSDSLVYVYAPKREYYPERYITELRMVRASDGTQIPLRLTYSRDLDLSRPQAVLLSAYGAYGDAEDPYFSRNDFSLLSRGLILATAHVRGGGEFGDFWHEQGKLMNKRNTFTDFIACMDYLIANRITNPERLAISGGSAGGLLVGAVLNMAPQKMKVALADVPFVDLMNTMLDADLPLTIPEYDEWGNPNDPLAFQYMLSYSPYDNVTAQNYPHVLITAGWQDTRVGYWEGLKWAQQLRSFNQSGNKILFRLMRDEGHSGSGDRFEGLRYHAETMAYVLYLLGIRK